MDDNMNIIHGVNFASADYLGLAKNEFAKEAAIEAATNFGVNSAGSPLAFGATKYFKFSYSDITCNSRSNSLSSGVLSLSSSTLQDGLQASVSSRPLSRRTIISSWTDSLITVFKKAQMLPPKIFTNSIISNKKKWPPCSRMSEPKTQTTLS